MASRASALWWGAIVSCLWACGATPPLARDGGAATDAGREDGGSLAFDGGAPFDGGSRLDGGSTLDGGSRFDGGSTRDGGSSADGGRATDGGAADGGTTLEADDAEVVSHDLPTTMLAGQSARATIVMANRGTSTWTRASAYKLGGTGDSDPFADARVDLPDGVAVPGGASPPRTFAFELTLVAPTTPGTYVTEWRMLREFVRWFGAVVSQSIEVRAFEGCSNPVPPPIDLLRVVVHNDQGFRKVLDSTALVWGREYCAEIGFTDGRSRCPVRPEGHPEVQACNEVSVGHASDTDRVGPTWTFNGNPCNESAEAGTCKNHWGNQFLVFVHGTGTARACTASRVCGEVTIP